MISAVIIFCEGLLLKIYPGKIKTFMSNTQAFLNIITIAPGIKGEMESLSSSAH